MDLPEVEARRALSEVAAQVRVLKATIAVSLYELGQLLLDVRERELWRLAGRASFLACLEEDLEISRATAYRAMDIAQHFGPEIARRYGSEKLIAMHRYLKATGKAEQPGDLLAADLQLRGASGRFESVPLHQATLTQIEDATHLLKQRQADSICFTGVSCQILSPCRSD